MTDEIIDTQNEHCSKYYFDTIDESAHYDSIIWYYDAIDREYNTDYTYFCIKIFFREYELFVLFFTISNFLSLVISFNSNNSKNIQYIN